MIKDFDDYAKVLKNELLERRERNPRYSLRAFSRDLGISPARLSRMLSGKAAPSRATAIKIGRQLGYRDDKLNWYCALVDARYGRSAEIKRAAQETLKRYENGVLSRRVEVKNSLDWNWYHFAIRRLTRIADFQFDYRWIAQKLGLSWMQVKKTVEGLMKIGALTVIEGKLVIKENYSVYFSGNKPEVRKKMEIDLFERKLPSILYSDRKKSHHGRHYFVIDKNQVPELIKLIRKFEDEVDDLTHKYPSPANDLYCLTVDLWSLLTKTEEEKHKATV